MISNIVSNLKSLTIFDVCTIFDIIKGIVIVAIFFALRGPLTYFIVRLFNLKEKDKSKIKKSGIYNPMKAFFFVCGIYLGISVIDFRESVKLGIDKVFRIVVILIVAKALANITSKNSRIMRKLQKKLHITNSSSVVKMISNVIAGVIYAFAAVIIINELGYDVNGLVAGLGLGGLTVALAAQDLAANIFAGFVIIFDKPFAIGDWIKTDDVEGNVEEITFRSTRIRKFDDTLVIIPNNKITNSTLVNCSKMEKRKITFDLQIDMSVDMKKLNSCLQKVKKALLTSENIIPESVLVFFDKIEDSGYNMYVSLFTTELSYANYLKVKENINYKIMEVLNKEKVGLAYPSKTIYLREEK